VSAIIPPDSFPAVDQRSGLLTNIWRQFLTALTKLPSARLSGSATYDPPNLGAGATTTTTVAVPGATLGWDASAAFSLSLSGLAMTAYVSAADTVTVVLFNPTGAPINLAAGTLTAWSWQP
jgi:hypothetical protein